MAIRLNFTLPLLTCMHHSEPNILCHVAFADFTQTSLDMLKKNQRLSGALQDFAATLPSTRQHQFLASRALLAELLFHHHRINELPQITTHNNNRPQFCDNTLPDFNISHSGNMIAVALSTTGNIGLDIEVKRPRPRLLQIAKKQFSEKEYHWLRSLPENEQQAGFWQLWTLRESILKACAKGVWQMKEITLDPALSVLSTEFCDSLVSYHQQNAHLYWAVSCQIPMQILLLSSVDVISAGISLHSQAFAKNSLKMFHYSKNCIAK